VGLVLCVFHTWLTHSVHASVRNTRVLHILGGGGRSRKYDLVTLLTWPVTITDTTGAVQFWVLPNYIVSNVLAPLTFQSLPVTWCTNKFNIQQLYALPTLYIYMCFVFIWEQTANCATYIIYWLVFITEIKSVYCAAWTGSLNKTVCASSLNGWTPPRFKSRISLPLARTDPCTNQTLVALTKLHHCTRKEGSASIRTVAIHVTSYIFTFVSRIRRYH
jgi:hypothetical protein